VSSQDPVWSSHETPKVSQKHCGVGLAYHPLGEGTGDRPRWLWERFTASGYFGTPKGSPATSCEDYFSAAVVTEQVLFCFFRNV
jgi:hypothetical protein